MNISSKLLTSLVWTRNSCYCQDIRDGIHSRDIPVEVFVESLVSYISEPDVKYGENTSPNA